MIQKKTIGIIGGLGPESTVEYYRMIISGFRNGLKTDQYPNLIINSVNMTQVLDWVEKRDDEALVGLMSVEIGRLADAGAGFAAISSNTPHIVFPEIRKRASIPLISIVEETRKFAKKNGFGRLGLFGTKFTMTGGFYEKEFERHGMKVFAPDEKQREFIHQIYMNELVKGTILQATKAELIRIANAMRVSLKLDGLILGGTELPLILNQGDFPDFGILNTTEIHVKSILEYAAG
jgi:aspartate racemase